jgi:hypothetical protein
MALDFLQSVFFFISPLIALTNSSLIMLPTNNYNKSVLCNIEGFAQQFTTISQYFWILIMELVINN